MRIGIYSTILSCLIHLPKIDSFHFIPKSLSSSTTSISSISTFPSLQQTPKPKSTRTSSNSISIHLNKNQNDNDSNTDEIMNTDEELFTQTTLENQNNVKNRLYQDDDAFVLHDLQKRQYQLEKGIGKRYQTMTQKGFLNIHSDPYSEPYCLDNVIGQLCEGQIVTAIDVHEDWIRHDAKIEGTDQYGWSIRTFGGFTWLQALDD